MAVTAARLAWAGRF